MNPIFFYLGIMKVPPNQSDDHIISNPIDNISSDSDDGLNDLPHSPSREGDFSEYLWMENEEEFEEQIMQQLEEEALMQQCIEAMQDEMDSLNPANSGGYQNGNGASNGTAEDILTHGLQELSVHDDPSQVFHFCVII